MFNNTIFRPSGVDLSGHDGIVTMRLLHESGYLDVPLATRHALALADALGETAHEMAS